MQPINYLTQGPNPIDEVMAGVATGLNLQKEVEARQTRAAEQGRAAAGEVRAQESHEAQKAKAQAAAAKAKEAEARKQSFNEDISLLYKKDATVDDYLAVGAKYPEFGTALKETWDGLTESRQAGVRGRLMQIGAAIKSGNTDLAKDLAEEYAAAAENSGDMASAQIARGMSEIVEIDPDAAMTSLGMTLSTIDPKAAGKLFGEGARVQSSKIIGNGRVTVQNMSDGATKIIDTTTGEELTGDAAREAISLAEGSEVSLQGEKSGAREASKLDAQLEGSGKVKAAEGLGSLQAKFVDNAQKAIGNVSSVIRNMDRAIAALDAGGKSGAFDKLLPNITQASAELSNALNGLGLNVVGSVTFGALSEGELKLAMDVAAPRDLDEAQLKAWLLDRKDAQEKVVTALEEQARFLSDPNNTLEDWFKEVYSQKQVEPEAAAIDPRAGKYGLKEGTSAADIDRYIEILKRKHYDGARPTPQEVDFIRSISAG